MSEDCLFLNVWTPSSGDAARRPVLVYIHGGAYASGSGSSPLYDGARLVERGDVVVVTLNHRLNAFGYLYLDRSLRRAELADSGMCGQLDLVLALQWVRDNIAAFGGDPDCVTVFGQSGGGAKIATLMAMPAASGLFHRAATMSGQQVTASGPLNAAARTRALLDALGLRADTADEIRNLPAGRLVEAMQATDPIIGKGRIYFGPVLDERSLTRHPFYPDAPPLSAHIPMLIGNTRGETRNLIGRSDPSVFELRWQDLPDRLAGEMRADLKPELVVAAVPPALSAIFRERRLLRRDDCFALVAGRGHRTRGALARRRGNVRLPARLAVSSGRRQVGRLPRARHPAGVRDA